MSSRILLKPGTLWHSVLRVTGRALNSGALHSLPTEYEFIEDRGVRFFVRILKSLDRKLEEKKKKQEQSSPGKRTDPFLPYEKDLFVTDISDGHIALLNKFNVVDHHLLIVTREFEDQRMLLNIQDFEALCACMAEFDGLGFYNGGEEAGASQLHKHLQMVPLPLAPEGPKVPIEPLSASAVCQNGIGEIPGLPFLHSFVELKPGLWNKAAEAAPKAFQLYSELLASSGLNAPEADRLVMQSAPYCFLVTREWMLLVPRSRVHFDSVSINSLGFAGALLVRSRAQMEHLKKAGPMTALASVALPKD